MRRRGSVAKDKKARRRALVDQRLASLEERMTVPSATADEVTQVFQRVEKLEEGIRAEGSLATQVAHETAAQTEALATRIAELAKTAEALVGVDQRLASLEERMTVPSATADEVTQVFQRVEKLEEGIRAEGSLATQVAHETAAQTEALATRIAELAKTAEALVGVDQRLASLEERMTVPSATADEVTQVFQR